jgi:hypothetical protein
MALSPAEKLRQLLGETTEVDGDPADTLFTDEEIAGLLDEADGNIERAAYEGWRAKAAKFANLVDVTEGNAARSMSDLHDHAVKMMSTYARASAGPTEGRTRIGRIRRR